MHLQLLSSQLQLSPLLSRAGTGQEQEEPSSLHEQSKPAERAKKKIKTIKIEKCLFKVGTGNVFFLFIMILSPLSVMCKAR